MRMPVAKQKEAWRKEGMSEDEIAKKGAEMYSKLKSSATPITATNRDQLDSMITRIDTANGHRQVEALLKKHNALTGLGGKVTRPAETVSNWFGSNETDRAQFRRYIEELRELGRGCCRSRSRARCRRRRSALLRSCPASTWATRPPTRRVG